MKKTAVFVLLVGTILTFPAHGQQRPEKGQGIFSRNQAFRQDDIPNHKQGLIGLITAQRPRHNDPAFIDKTSDLEAVINSGQAPKIRADYPLPDLPLADPQACSAELQNWLLRERSPGYTTLEGIYATSGICTLGTMNNGQPFPASWLNGVTQ